jgi:hypothetical protein
VAHRPTEWPSNRSLGRVRPRADRQVLSIALCRLASPVCGTLHPPTPTARTRALKASGPVARSGQVGVGHQHRHSPSACPACRVAARNGQQNSRRRRRCPFAGGPAGSLVDSPTGVSTPRWSDTRSLSWSRVLQPLRQLVRADHVSPGPGWRRRRSRPEGQGGVLYRRRCPLGPSQSVLVLDA